MATTDDASGGKTSGASRNRAAVYSNPGTMDIQLVDLEIPKPGPGEVLVRLQYTGVCHTDVALCTNTFPGLPAPVPAGQIGGHEGIGQVVSLGAGVTKPDLGTTVGIQLIADACRKCSTCLNGSEASCPRIKISGFYTPGTFQQYCIASAKYVSPIPAGLDAAAAAPLMCGGVTVYTALKRAEFRQGDWAVVSGAGGGLGHLAIQYAKAMGGKVIAIDSANKEWLCRSVGADEFIDFALFPKDKDLAAKVKAITVKGAGVALMCAADPRPYAQALKWLRVRGTMACIGIPGSEYALTPSLGEMVTKELRIFGTKVGTWADTQECLALAAKGKVKPYYTIRQLDELPEVFHDLEHGKITGRVIIDLRGRSKM